MQAVEARGVPPQHHAAGGNSLILKEFYGGTFYRLFRAVNGFTTVEVVDGLESYALGRLTVSGYCLSVSGRGEVRGARSGGRRGGATRPEVIAIGAVAHIERESHDGKQHRMTAVEQLAFGNCMEADVGGNGCGPAAIPAKTVFQLRIVVPTFQRCSSGAYQRYLEYRHRRSTPVFRPFLRNGRFDNGTDIPLEYQKL
jgi:hypothetical protein